MFLVQSFAAIAFSMAWLLPNHYAPWSSFWLDFAAGLGLAFLFFGLLWRSSRTVLLPWSALAVGFVAILPFLQWACGQVFFLGDAFIVSFYLVGFGLAMITPPLATEFARDSMGILVGAVVCACIVSVGLALFQWLDIEGLSILLADMPSGGRPYANLAQPNQLATLLLLGIVASLALLQRQKIGSIACCFVIAWLCLGIAMTQSRSAWAAMAALVCWLLFIRKRAALRVNRGTLIGMGLGFGLLVCSWPALCDLLNVSAGRSLADQSVVGVRLKLWSSMLDAIGRAPWIGYGWNQVSVAQNRVADAHGAVGQWIEDAHNLVLELLVSNGVPLGSSIVSALAFWMWRRSTNCKDAETGLALGAIFVVGVHALFEFPLDYAYFLLPVGLLVGFIETKSPESSFVACSRSAIALAGIFAFALLCRVGYEYADIEQRNRSLRFEMAGYGVQIDREQSVDIVLLTQLEELPRFARTQATRNMSFEQVDSMRKMAERYGYPPVLFRYALAAGLNGKPESASRTLKVLCNVHPLERCAEAIEAWSEMTHGRYPELGAVSLPDGPKRAGAVTDISLAGR